MLKLHFVLMIFVTFFVTACGTATRSSTAQMAAAADRLLTCSTDKVSSVSGIRVNVIASDDGSLKASLFHGTTMNSTATYSVAKQNDHYVGSTRNGKFQIDLQVTNRTDSNQFIKGTSATLVVAEYVDLRKSNQKGMNQNVKLVCGKQIASYSH